MPVIAKININGKNSVVKIKDGTARPFFLGGKDIKRMVILGSEDNENGQEGLHLIVQALWVHRNGVPMGENESSVKYVLKPDKDKRIENGDLITICNPDKRKNLIEASYMAAETKK